MSLTPEWTRRIEAWKDELPKHVYRPLGRVEMSGFTTMEQLTPQEALRRDFQPMPPGTKWGAKWEYGWFKGELVLPEGAEGKRIALRVEVGGESLIFVNGEPFGARD
ncbi:MAG TPA: alpha-mannosidase, partial [Caldilineae bacterium]|nr:alpha-mannosidase [Caldilineae bacterium]